MIRSEEKPLFRRRIFLVKNRFQLLFVLIPLALYALFLGFGGLYLYRFIRGTLNYYIYQPHCRLENVWGEVAPAMINVAAVGGGVFLVLLGLWIWRKHHLLVRDLASLDRWAADFDEAKGHDLIKSLTDRETRLLAARLVKAAHHFHRWDATVLALKAQLLEEARKLETTGDDEFIPELARLADRWKALTEEVNRVRIDERLS